MGTVMGYLAGVQDISTFVDVQVLRKFEGVDNADVTHQYILNLGEAILTHPAHFYLDSFPGVATMKVQIIAVFNDILTGNY
jgi:hypothetical protein